MCEQHRVQSSTGLMSMGDKHLTAALYKQHVYYLDIGDAVAFQGLLVQEQQLAIAYNGQPMS